MDARRIDEIRRASFPAARRGYDRDAVDDFLDRLASSLEAEEPDPTPEPGGAVKAEIAKLGERTAGILSAAEEAAARVRSEADKHLAESKSAAEEGSRRVRLETAEKAQQMVADAEKRAEKIIDDAVARRRQLNQAITSLSERRDEIAVETRRLAADLTSAVGRLSEFDQPLEDEPAAEEPPHPPEAQAAVPDRPAPSGDDEAAAKAPAPAVEPDPPAEMEIVEDTDEPESLDPIDDGGDYAAESDVYDVLEEGEEPSREIQLLVDPDEEDDIVVRPANREPGPDPTEETPMRPADSEDEPEAEDPTTVQPIEPKKPDSKD